MATIRTEEKNLDEILLHPFFAFAKTIKARYFIVGGGKDGGKSALISTENLIIDWLAEPKRNIAVLRKYESYSSTSTLPKMLWALRLIAKTFDLPQLEPVAAEDYKKNSNNAIIKYKKTTPQYIENTLTHQKIFFSGLDRLAAGGFELDDPTHAIDKIWCEEFVDIEDSTITKDKIDDSSFNKWLVAESTIFRGTYEEDEDGNQVRREGFEWVQEQVFFSFNAHNSGHWLIRDFLDKYTPFNPNSEEDCKRMEEMKFFAYWDPDYQKGDGLLVMRLSTLFNPGRDRKKIAQMKEEDMKTYAYLFLGATKHIGGLAYQGYDRKLITADMDFNDIWPLSIGIDHANSVENGDWFAASFLGCPISRTIIGGENREYPDFSRKIFYEEYAQRNKDMIWKSDVQMARDVIFKLIQLVEKNSAWKYRIMEHKIFITIDSSATSFKQIFAQEIVNIFNSNPQLNWMHGIRLVDIYGKNLTQVIDSTGVKVKGRKGRVEKNRRYLDYEMIQIIKDRCFNTYSGFLNTSIDLSGEVIDRERDFVDAMDYAWMFNPLDGIFENVLKKKRYKYNKDLSEGYEY